MTRAEGLRFDANLKWMFTELDFLERFDAAAQAGFRGVEYSSPYAYPAAELRQRLSDAGLTQVLINTPGGAPGTPEAKGAACLPGLEARFRADFERALEYAVELDSEFIHLMAGAPPAEVGRDRAFARFVTNVSWAADAASSTAVKIVLEAQNKRDSPGFLLESQDHAVAVVDAVDAANVGVLLDVYHVQVDEGDLVTTLKRILPRTFHMQIADPPGRHEPGTGEINFRTIFDTIVSSGYSGWIGCEYAPKTDTWESLSWMQQWK